MSRVRTHLLLPPLELPDPPKYRTTAESARNADRVYRQLRERGYSHEKAEQLSSVARLNGAPIIYSQPEEGAA